MACLWIAVVQLRSSSRPAIGVIPENFYSIDEGKTYFTASSSNIAPFDYNGHPAVRALVFEASGKQFVGYVERYKADTHAAKVAGTITPLQELNGREVKKPGDTTWVPSSNRKAFSTVTTVAAPAGLSGDVVPIEP